MSNRRLYKAQYVGPEEGFEELEEFENGWFVEVPPPPMTEAEGAPEGWDAHCLEVWGKPHMFSIPSDRPIYRSRSSAQNRVDLINRWGGNAVLVETETDWIPVSKANARRRNKARRARINKLANKAAQIAKEMEDA